MHLSPAWNQASYSLISIGRFLPPLCQIYPLALYPGSPGLGSHLKFLEAKEKLEAKAAALTEPFDGKKSLHVKNISPDICLTTLQKKVPPMSALRFG